MINEKGTNETLGTPESMQPGKMIGTPRILVAEGVGKVLAETAQRSPRLEDVSPL
jgi:hypothetical protein